MIRLCILAGLTAGLAGCQSAGPHGQGMPEACQPSGDLATLSGTYAARDIGINSRGKHSGSSTLSLAVDRDGVITAERRWTSAVHSGHTRDGAETRSDSERLIGIVDRHDCTISLVETAENGHYQGRLLADGSINLMLLQPGGRPVVILNRYQRSGRSN